MDLNKRSSDINREALEESAIQIAREGNRRMRRAAFGAGLVVSLFLSIIGYYVFQELQEQNASVQAQNERLEQLVLDAQDDREARTDQTRRLLARFNHEQEREDQRNRKLLVTLRRAVRNNVDRINALIKAILRTSPEGREILQEIRERQGDAEPPSQQ
jgi:type I site-specific restriction-modification system R (restriction) subunit